MRLNTKWEYDENVQVGADYQDISNVQAYDEEMGIIRDLEKEATDIIQTICLQREHSLLEIGTGTGHFSIEAAKYCDNVSCVIG